MLTFRTKYGVSPLYRGGVVTIVLSQYSVDRDQDLCLTEECRTPEELREEVERLKKELDSILEQGVRRLGE